MNFKRKIFKNKKPKIFYYIPAIIREYSNNYYLHNKKEKILTYFNKLNPDEIYERVNYYNKLNTVNFNEKEAIAIKIYKFPKHQCVYYFDSKEYLRYFDSDLKFYLSPGDITDIPQQPTLVKSRPISENNQNSILLKLNKIRHFNFIHDNLSYLEKEDKLIGRGGIWQEHRIRFYEQYFNHPLCDLGAVDGVHLEKWKKPKITINEHLKYKFILTLEGNDVASNLKWVMSSNSIAVMPTPKYETWFMEGKLLPDVHYIHILDDYSNLEEKLNFYIQHPDKSEAIIKNAHNYIQQFLDAKKEQLISLLVLEKYFYCTGQKDSDWKSFFDIN